MSSPAIQLQPFWKCTDHYGRKALAGTFAAQARVQETADKFVIALSKLICDGQDAGAAYGIVGAFHKNPGPFTMRTMQMEFEYDHLSSRRAASIAFYVAAPASRINSILPVETSGLHNPPLPESKISQLQRVMEHLSRPENCPPYHAVNSSFWLGDLCGREAGLPARRSLHTPLAAGLFERENGAFISTDKALMVEIQKLAEQFYPHVRADNDPGAGQAPRAATAPQPKAQIG